MDKNTLVSSFGKWVAPINTKKLEDHVEKTGQDKYVKKLTTRAYLLFFLHAHLEKRDGLRAIADDALQEEFQQEIGLTSISAAQLSRKHRRVEPSLLAELFIDLVHKLRPHSRHTCAWKEELRIVDCSTVSLCLNKYKWTTFRKTKAGVKIHLRLVFLNDNDVVPDKVEITSPKPSDRTQMETLIDETGATYVFDRGHVDYEKFDQYCEQGIFFTSRLKKNAVIRPLSSFSVAEESPVLSDMMVYLGTPQKRMENPVRLIETVDDQGNSFRIVTNRFDLSAEEISDIYRARWAIELFFKWLKQHVKIKTFYGTSKNTVANQIYLALIFYCLVLLVKAETKTNHSLLQLTRWLTAFLCKPWEKWFERIRYRSDRASRGRQKKK
ncbi:IS4 family transposase [Aneurinibacillus tyrosinisolvens]|uniref:IS4 family transposase n=1 Tax=Aneurinibacillus tyrosinisolvens TaxID=1443435 RepID=UPI00063EF8DC|nr:IS4 family transposase [Aneurinibacillus tyrosinisolvens]